MASEGGACLTVGLSLEGLPMCGEAQRALQGSKVVVGV